MCVQNQVLIEIQLERHLGKHGSAEFWREVSFLIMCCTLRVTHYVLQLCAVWPNVVFFD